MATLGGDARRRWRLSARKASGFATAILSLPRTARARAARSARCQVLARERGAVRTGGVLGKKLDFIVQEINREINTIGSKANDIEITNLVIGMKTELEKIREQIQNIE